MLNADALSSLQNTDILGLAQRRMQWLEKRQQVLAANVANADTPDYVPKDVTPFDSALSQFDITPMITNPMHIAVAAESTTTLRDLQEKAPDGNQVSLDQQMEKVADTSDQQHLVTSLYSKYVTMFTTVLDK